MSVDLRAYAKRIEYAGALTPTLDTLRALHLAHATHIPFENLDVLWGRPGKLDIESLSAKLIDGKRGGYCFEQNALFAAVLEAIGFGVTRLAARVRLGSDRIGPRSHMLLAVQVAGEKWLADVGFGGEGLLFPLPLEPDRETQHFDWRYRLVRENEAYVLQSLRKTGWFDLYAFTLERQEPADYEVSHYYTGTHPSSRFVQKLIVQQPGKGARWTLVERLLTEWRPDGSTTETLLADDEAVRAVLAERFGLQFPAGTGFPVNVPSD
jgi:N-hydroxyarylamine O-acetyltransferase